jgi:phage tail-like protein
MAELRERPYSQFNYLVDLGTGDVDSPHAGFQEVTGLGVEVTVSEYRNGNEPINAPRKINTMYKATDVTLKRGLIGAEDLYEWLDQVRAGAQQEALRNVRISLLSEDRRSTAVTWTLINARPMKYTGPSLNGKGTDVAIEELVLACEDVQMA